MPAAALAIIMAALVAAGVMLSYAAAVEWRQRAAHQLTMRLVSAVRDDRTPASRYTPRHRKAAR